MRFLFVAECSDLHGSLSCVALKLLFFVPECVVCSVPDDSLINASIFLRFGAFSWFERKRPRHRLLGSGVGVGSMDRVRFMRPLSGKSVRCADTVLRGACGARGALPCRSADRWFDYAESTNVREAVVVRRGSTQPIQCWLSASAVKFFSVRWKLWYQASKVHPMNPGPSSESIDQLRRVSTG